MEGKNPRKSFKIPIEQYKKDIDTESSKGKKNEILDLLNNSNKLRSQEEFNEIKYELHNICKEGDVDLIKIYLSEKIQNISNGLQFKIDETSRTASLFKVDDDTEEVLIPRTVEHESKEYLITSICGTCRNLRTMKFVEDSAVKTVYEYSFPYDAQISEIHFPASLKELKGEWCLNTLLLNKIVISPSNGQFEMREDKYLVGKSDLNKDEFDILLFVRRDIDKFSIPSNIRVISPCAFNYCLDLTTVEIPTNSNLQTIGKNAFFFSGIKEIFIPSKVSVICEHAFNSCAGLTKVEIPTNSNLRTIKSYAFSESSIKEIYFPASLKELKKEWCFKVRMLNKITVSPSNDQFKILDDKYLVGKSDPNKDEFSILLFAFKNIKEISIPSNIKIISSYAFQHCRNLTTVEIPTNSILQIIGSKTFSETNIREIFIPSKVTEICDYAFYYCNNLTKVEIPTNSNLQTIGSYALSHTNIKEIFFPASLI